MATHSKSTFNEGDCPSVGFSSSSKYAGLIFHFDFETNQVPLVALDPRTH